MHINYKLIILTIFIICSTNNSNARRHHCPTMCVCDLYMELNRANCSNQNLIDCNIDMPRYVQYLNLSENSITNSDNLCFHDLKHLEILILANNSISVIHLDSFSHLKRLRELDISHNRLAWFDHRIVEENHKLISLNLSWNKFMNLENRPLIKSNSLQILDLQSSQIAHIHPKLFELVPNIRQINLAGNIFITINVSPFEQLHKIISIDLSRNNINCDRNAGEALQWFKKKKVGATIEGCTIQKGLHMFEKMQMMPTSLPPEINRPYQNISDVWKIKKLDCPGTKNADKICEMFETCLRDLADLTEQVFGPYQTTRKSIFLRVIPNSWLTLKNAFITGLVIGLIVAMVLTYIIWYIIKGCSNSLEHHQMRRAAIKEINRARAYERALQAVEMSSEPVVEIRSEITTDERVPPIPPYRHRRSNNRSERPPPQRRTNAFTMFQQLFERPTRRRYYRTINRQTSNLVRRLSQSRLFVSPSRAERNEIVAATNSRPTNDRDTEHLLTNQQSISTLTNLSTQSLPSLYTSNHIDSNMEVTFDMRAETPPPPYKDVTNNRI